MTLGTDDCVLMWEKGSLEMKFRQRSQDELLWVAQVGTKANDRCPCKRRKRGGQTDRHTDDARHVNGEAKIEMMPPQVREHQGPPEAGRANEGASHGTFRRDTAWLAPRFRTSGLLENKFLLFR